jgi:chaperonin cofactor prefoldin
MTEIQQIRKRLENIEIKIAKYKYEYNMESLKEELEDITQQIYKAVDKANKEEREELNELIMLANIIRAKLK